MRKIIKKIMNVLGWLLLSIIFMGIILVFLIKSPSVQRLATDKVAAKLSERFGTGLSYDGVKFRLFNKVEFEGVLIKDLANDTIVYAPILKAGIQGLVKKALFDKEAPLSIGRLEFEESLFRLYTDSTDEINIRFLIDSLKAGRDTATPSKPLYIHKIKAIKSRFVLAKYDTARRGFGIEFSDMEFNELNIKLEDLAVYSDTIQMNIKEMTFREQSGFRVKKFNSLFTLTKKQLNFDNCRVITDDSELNLSKTYFAFDDYSHFAKDFFNLIKLNISSEGSILNFADMAFFSDFFKGVNQEFELSGNFYGYLSNFNARNLDLRYGKNSLLKGRFDISGLPNPEETFLLFDIDEFVSTVDDINNINLPRNKKITLPERLSAVKSYKYKGNFTGFFKDFVSYGTITSDLGILRTDILFRPDSVGQVTFNGQLESVGFNIGALTSNPDKLGKISFDMNINGYGHIDKGFEIDIDGNISEFFVNQYNYTNVNVDGVFSERRFNGKLEINDPNAKVSFDGLVDLSSKVRKYNFKANVLHANLFKLNIHKKDSNYVASFLMDADLEGNGINEINGEMRLLNSLFSKSDAQIQVYGLDLKVRNDSTLNELDLKSDFLDANISGRYKLSLLHREFTDLLHHFMPAFFEEEGSIEHLDSTNFKYSLNFKNSQPVFEFFLPNYLLTPNSTIEGDLVRNGKLEANLVLQSPKIRLNKTTINEAVINAGTRDSILNIELGCKNLLLNNRMAFDNFSLETQLDSNNAGFIARWMNWDSALYKGRLSGDIALFNKPGQKLKGKVNVNGTELVINDSVWGLENFTIEIDSSRLDVLDFRLSHKQEVVYASGSLNDMNKADSIKVEFTSFNFANLNSFTRSNSFLFGGILDGNAAITGFTKPLFFAELEVEGLELNGELIGDTEIRTKWNDKIKAVDVNADVYRGKLNTLHAEGMLYPFNDNELDIGLTFDKFRLGFINPYLNSIFDEVNGNATGVLSLKGTTQDFSLNGNLNLQRAGLTVNYLKTRYHFTTNLGISNNNLVFNNVEFFDEYGNIAVLNGMIRTKYFKEYDLNLSIDANKFQFLNTTLADNELFYGTAFASGLIRINGEPESLKFDVTAKTEPGTRFNIPLSDNEELGEYNFIRYISTDTANVELEEEYKVNLTGMQMDFDLQVTPDAIVKLIFDPTIGDEIEAKGNGDMRIVINTLGDFKIIGEYIIEQGDYLFTMQDVLVNKKFKVEQGSSVRWSGDPVNADIDINTYYQTKASLADLDPIFALEGTSKKTVDCKLKLTGKLMQPIVNYDIYLPYSAQGDRDKVQSRINTEEEKGKQFLALLIMNRFLPSGSSEGPMTDNIAGVGNNGFEMLSNQFSNMLSQISNDFDVDFNYRPQSDLSEREINMALSTQLLNDRLSINGSIDMKTKAETDNASNFVGDVDIDYKITPNGRLRARVFNRGNESDEIREFSPYTQGAGVFYTEEFDKFNEVLIRYKEAFFNRKKKKKNKDRYKDGLENEEAILNEQEE